MAENPYESPTAPSSLDRQRRLSHRLPWYSKFALFVASVVVTIVVVELAMYLLSDL